MTVNLHPAVVHFPVALITLYGLLMAFTPPPLRRRAAWYPIVSFLVIVGALGSVGGYLTGLGIEPEFRGAGAQFDALLDAHMFWATATLVLSVLFALLHAVVLFIKPPEELALAAVKPGFRLWLRKFAFRLTHLPFSALVGSVLLCVITVTGALGGAIAYGRDADPLVAFVIRFLGL